jgi:tRNA A58 N-methylase Trm61
MGQSLTTEIQVSGDPRIEMSQTDYEAKVDALLHLRDLLSETHEFIDYVSSVIDQTARLKEKLESHNQGDTSTVESLHKELSGFKDEHLMRPPPSMNYRQRPRLREEIRSLMRAIDNTTNPPTIPQLERIESLKAELIQHQKTMETMEVQVKKINTSHSSIPQIILNP